MRGHHDLIQSPAGFLEKRPVLPRIRYEVGA
jgi:hypothetical protein